MCRTAVCALAISWCALCQADQWGPPQQEHWSANRQFLLEVGRPEGTLTLLQCTGDSVSRKKIWTRSYVDRTWPPHAAYVANDGKHVVLRDVYHNLGYGQVLVFLDDKGGILRGYELSDLLTQAEILETKHSLSSIWWSEPGWFSFLKEDTLFAFVTANGTIQCFDVARGERVSLDERMQAGIRPLACKDVSAMLKSRDYHRREAGAKLAKALDAVEFVPDLKTLLQDRTVTAEHVILFGQYSWSDYYGVQVAAADALAKFLHAGAVPLIEPLLSDSPSAVRRDLLNVIDKLDAECYEVRETPDSAYLLKVWHHLMQSPLEDVRKFATRAVVRREQAQYILDRPELLDDPDDRIRLDAVSTLERRGDERAVPLLKKALRDADPAVQVWAFRGLIKCRPPDLPAILQEGLKSNHRSIRLDAMAELVRRGDKPAIDAIKERLAAFETHTHDREGWGVEEMEAQDLCELVAELRLQAAEPALRRAGLNGCEKIKRPVSGALAALGDAKALAELRQFATHGEPLDRAMSVTMLGLVGDRASLPLLKDAAKDREPWVRQAAEEAIARINAH